MRQIIILILITLTLSACPDSEDEHSYITLINQSNKTIAWQASMKKVNDTNTLYDCQKIAYLIPSDSTYKFHYDNRMSWEIGLTTDYYLLLTLIEGDTYLYYYLEPCDTIQKYMSILHRYQLTIEDLQRMNWTVVYPPNEE